LTGSGSNGDKTEMAKVLGQFVSNEMVTQVINYLKMLADFRKNVMIRIS
jgi:hypothetical protein